MAKERKIDSGTDFSREDNPFAIGEIKTDGAQIETVSPDRPLDQVARDEAFMNELVVVRVHASKMEGDLDIINISVNGVNQPIVRDVPTPVKRKYVEAMARSVETKFSQYTPNPTAPDEIQMRPKTVPSYPFVVEEDRNPLGRQWLERILKAA